MKCQKGHPFDAEPTTLVANLSIRGHSIHLLEVDSTSMNLISRGAGASRRHFAAAQLLGGHTCCFDICGGKKKK